MCAKHSLEPQVLQLLEIQGKDLLNAVAKAVEKARVAGFPQEQMQVLTGVYDLIDHALLNLSESAKISESKDFPGGVDVISPANLLLNSLANLRSDLDLPQKVPESLKAVSRAQNGLLAAMKGLAQSSPPEVEQVRPHSLSSFPSLIRLPTCPSFTSIHPSYCISATSNSNG
jgi:hypothetical protein